MTNPHKPRKLSRELQAKKFQNLLDSGKVKSRAELARKFGVSRAWVTKVLNLSVTNFLKEKFNRINL